MAPKYVKEIVVQTSYHSYPFVPPEVKPETKYFCKKKTVQRSVRRSNRPAAKSATRWLRASLIKVCSPTATVKRSCERSKNRASKNSPNGPIKAHNAWTATIGFTRGKTICQKIRKCPAPSSFADSSKSMGTVSKYPSSAKYSSESHHRYKSVSRTRSYLDRLLISP